MQIIQIMDLREEVVEFLNALKSFASSESKGVYVALEVLDFVPEERLTTKFLLETIKKVLEIELTNLPDFSNPNINQYQVINWCEHISLSEIPEVNIYRSLQVFLNHQKELYKKLTGE